MISMLLLLGSLCGTVPSSEVFVGGTERTVFELVHPVALPPIPDHTAYGFKQRVLRHDGRRALVEVSSEASHLGSHSVYPIEFLPDAARPYLVSAPDPTLSSAAKQATDGIHELHSVSAALYDFAYRHIEERTKASPDPDPRPASVWKRGTATCVGRANVAVALHRAAGLPARTVHGIRWTKDPGSTARISSKLLHRWTEVFLPDRGWIPSDPAHSIHFVTSSYLILGLGEEKPREVDQRLKGLTVRILQREGAVRPNDRTGSPRADASRLPRVPNTPDRHAGAVLVEAPPRVALHLEGPGGTHKQTTDVQGYASFLGLTPGLYRLKRANKKPLRAIFLSKGEEVRVQLR